MDLGACHAACLAHSNHLLAISPATIGPAIMKGCERRRPVAAAADVRPSSVICSAGKSVRGSNGPIGGEQGREEGSRRSAGGVAATSSGGDWVEEQGMQFELGGAFYRAESSMARDMAMLAVLVEQQRRRELGEGREVRAGRRQRKVPRSESESRGGDNAAVSFEFMHEDKGDANLPSSPCSSSSPPLPFRVLDVMCASGMRGARYLAHANASFVWCNDACLDLRPLIVNNLSAGEQLSHATSAGEKLSNATSAGEQLSHAASAGEQLSSATTAGEQTSDVRSSWRCEWAANGSADGGKWRVTSEDATRLLFHFHQTRNYFDLVDVDSFGSDSSFISAALMATRIGGLLYVTSTDGFSSAGHAPFRSLASYGCYLRPLPFCNEMGLRCLTAVAVKEAAQRGLSVSPLFSLYSPHGPVFRVMLKVSATKQPWQAEHFGFLSYCHACGVSRVLPWPLLSQPKGEAPTCQGGGDADSKCNEVIVGPLWTGPLHDGPFVGAMRERAAEKKWRKTESTLRIMQDEADERLPPGYIRLDLISKMAKVKTPRKEALVSELKNLGFAASICHIESTAIRTNCPIHVLKDVVLKMQDALSQGVKSY